MKAADYNICMIGHRGYSSKYHENTEQAFIKAAEHGSGGCETDIRITKDGMLICSHNEEVILNDGTELIVADTDYKDLVSRPLRNKRNNDEVYLCTFERYLEIMRDNNMVCFLELKGDFPDEKVAEVYATADRVYDLSKFILQSFSHENLKKSRKLYPDIPLMLTLGDEQLDYDFCFKYNISLDIYFGAVNKEIIDRFHEHGLEVALWTVNEREDFEKCKLMNVDYIESDVFGGND